MSTLLRRVLMTDTAFSGLSMLALILAAGPLAGPLGLPESFLRSLGLILVPFVAFIAWVALRRPLVIGAIRTLIVGNALWVLASIALLASGWLSPSGLGTAFIVGQAVVVGIFAELQLIGLRRSTAAEATL